ncbi:MAG: DUF3570 domain-containing protein [Anaeromyxobacteraceae bacterium]
MRRAALAALALAASACAAAGGPRATVRLQGFRYADSGGLSVTSDGVEVQQPVGSGVAVRASGLVEEITLPGSGAATGGDDGGGHQHLVALSRARPDVVTSASSIATVGGPGQKRRVEGNLSALAARRWGEVPVELEARFRTSQEPDYLSMGGTLHASADLLERNLTVSGFAGFGADTVSPTTKPAGQEALWPAQHSRWNAGIAVTQLLSPALALSAGASVNWQQGTLANPYRRALVVTTAFPESVPGERVRGTAFARLAWFLGAGTALHLRQGLYADDWGVRAVIPEVTLAKELGRSGLALARARWYAQSPARFYQSSYATIEPLMTGDVRLGRVQEALVGAELRYTLLGEPGAAGTLDLAASYDRATVRYPDVAVRTSADIISAAVSATF